MTATKKTKKGAPTAAQLRVWLDLLTAMDHFQEAVDAARAAGLDLPRPLTACDDLYHIERAILSARPRRR